MFKKYIILKLLIASAAVQTVIPQAVFANNTQVNPSLIEVVEDIKQLSDADRAESQFELRTGPITESQADIFVTKITNIYDAIYNRDADRLRVLADELKDYTIRTESKVDNQVAKIHSLYADAIEKEVSQSAILSNISEFTSEGHWFVRYSAFRLSSYLHAENLERQSALRDAQYALVTIPEDGTPLAHYAKTHVIELIAKLHNLQNNPDLAIAASKEFLELTEHDFKPEASLDLLNNLLFSHSNWRDHETQKYLASEILELEKTISSSIPGLTELRIARTLNDSQNFTEALDFAKQSYQKTAHPSVMKQARQAEAIALAGLGETRQAIAVAEEVELSLSKTDLMASKSSDSLYLGYLLAMNRGDRATAIALYNRRLDVTSQKLLSASSRDTSSMLASLENSRERQAERAAAAEREALLQAQTIDKQRKLNRALIILVILLAIATTAMLIFLKYREKIMKKLAIKTKEAASADKLKTEFLGLISHELRTPLNGIIGFSDILSRTHQDPGVRQKSSIILESGNDLLTIVEAMTDMARIDAKKMEILPEETNVSELLTELASAFEPKAQAKNVAFTAYVDPALSEHKVDGVRLRQCVETLLSNAVSFTDSGRVHLHTKAQISEAGEVTGLKLIVADTGLGMTDLVQSRLFTPFMQADTSMRRKHQGPGLSLAIARALARMMGGDISVLSRQGRGSEFTLTVDLAPIERQNLDVAVDGVETVETALPTPIVDLMQPQSKDAPAPLHQAFAADADPDGLAGLHVLIVGSDESSLNALLPILETAGCISTVKPDSEAALAALESGSMTVVILDLDSDPEMAIETARLIRSANALFANIPIVALTSVEVAEKHAACLAAGVDLFLMKPASEKDLTDALLFLQADSSDVLMKAVSA